MVGSLKAHAGACTHAGLEPFWRVRERHGPGSHPPPPSPAIPSFQQIMHYHMQNEQYRKVVEVCEQYGDQEACLWEQALGYFAHKEEDCKEYIAAVLKHIETKNLMPPLLGEWGGGTPRYCCCCCCWW